MRDGNCRPSGLRPLSLSFADGRYPTVVGLRRRPAKASPKASVPRPRRASEDGSGVEVGVGSLVVTGLVTEVVDVTEPPESSSSESTQARAKWPSLSLKMSSESSPNGIDPNSVAEFISESGASGMKSHTPDVLSFVGVALGVRLDAEAMLGKSAPIDNARSVLRTTLTRLHFISGLPTLVFLRAQKA